MVKTILCKFVVTGTAPGRRQEDCVKLRLGFLIDWYHLLCITKFQEITVNQTKVLLILQSIHFGVVSSVLKFLGIHIDSETESTFLTKLDKITTDPTESIKNIGLALLDLVF